MEQDACPPEWSDSAECRKLGLERDRVFYPTRNAYADARRVCAVCEVLACCALFAMVKETDEPVKMRFGMWGGMTPRERRRASHSFFG